MEPQKNLFFSSLLTISLIYFKGSLTLWTLFYFFRTKVKSYSDFGLTAGFYLSGSSAAGLLFMSVDIINSKFNYFEFKKSYCSQEKVASPYPSITYAKH